MANNYLKRCAAWATGWWERFANKALTRLLSREILEGQKLFISNVAHELRTPLSTIKTSAEVALIDTGLPRDARMSFREILQELERISEILNNLLSLSALARPEHMHFMSLDLYPLAEAAVARHKPLARERGIRLRLRHVPGAVAWANRAGVEQIFTNLVKNAVLYTPPGGTVAVTLEPRGERVRITVEDTGVGISKESLEHIFEPFYRADASRTRLNKSGAGLGLTIVAEMVRAHEGTIHIDSRRRRPSGTSVRVELLAGGWRREASISGGAHHAEASADFTSRSGESGIVGARERDHE